MKTIVAFVVALIIGAGGMYVALKNPFSTGVKTDNQAAAAGDTTPAPSQQATTTPAKDTETIIGQSVEKNDITAYHFGTGEKELLFVGGTHGGYSWSTALVAYEMMDYLSKNPTVIPTDVRVTIIPILNPDGLKKVTGTTGRFTKDDVSASASTREAGRFNAHKVDLNRNFDCAWQASGTWQKKQVSGGSTAFSEPESAALKTYIEAHNPAAAVVWFSAGGGVYASECDAGVLPETEQLMNAYAKAAGYAAHEQYDSYEVTGDMVNWLAKLQIPAISVLLTTHDATEWAKNKAGIDALLKRYATAR